MVKHMKQILHHLGWNMLKHVEPCWTPINNGLVGTDRLVQDFATIHSTCPVMENQTYGIRWQSGNPNFFPWRSGIFWATSSNFFHDQRAPGVLRCGGCAGGRGPLRRSERVLDGFKVMLWPKSTWWSSLSVLMRIQEIDLDLRESRNRKPWFLPVKYRGIL